MKKLLSILLAISFMFCLTGCKGRDERVLNAIEEFEDYWEDFYDDYEERRKKSNEDYSSTDKYLEITNTKVINIKRHVKTDIAPEYWKEIDYIVEFSFETNYYDTTPDYYSNNMNVWGNCVVVYKDGRMEVESNIIPKFINDGIFDFSGIIDSIENFHGEYDQIIELD